MIQLKQMKLREHINYILLSILWVLAIILGGMFWLNITFKFDILSKRHWLYLSELQASGQHINNWFYITIIIIGFIMLGGLYMILRPHKFKFLNHNSQPIQKQIIRVPEQTNIQKINSNIPVITKTNRPPRPIIHQSMIKNFNYGMAQNASNMARAQDSQQKINIVSNILKSAGYEFKGIHRINNIQQCIVAIGYNETLWIGAIGATPQDMSIVIEKLNDVFDDTLDDIDIDINSFIISTSDTIEDNNGINIFKTTDEFSEFMNSHKNEIPESNETDDMEAYSSYITTVLGYIGNS